LTAAGVRRQAGKKAFVLAAESVRTNGKGNGTNRTKS
jgi:hypothetical protein